MTQPNPFRRTRQCPACPWKKSVDCAESIPNYKPGMHQNLARTCKSDGFVRGAVMACHESKEGDEYACVGWLMNQLGDGNNIPLRIAAMNGRIGKLKLDGAQYESLDAMCEREQPSGLCEVCECPFEAEDLSDGCTTEAECCGRTGLCQECRLYENHDCDQQTGKRRVYQRPSGKGAHSGKVR